MNFVKENGNRFGIFYLLIGLLFFSIFLAYVWRFTVDDAYISFRYAKHLAEGYGLVWNVGELPVEGYTNFLWVVIIAFIHLLKLDPVFSTKIIGILALIGIVYLYWKIANDVLQNNRTLGLIVFCASLAFLLANPATAIHTVSGLETMFYTACLLGVTYLAYRLTKSPEKRVCWLFAIVALIGSLLRPEGILVSIALFVLVYILSLQKGKLEWDKKSFLVPFVLAYILPIAAYMVFRVYYFHELFPLSFYAKTVSHGGLFSGFYSLIGVSRFIAPFLIIILIAIFQNIEAIWHEQKGQYARFRTLLIITIATILSTNVIYLFSSLWMNYAQRFYYPSFVIIYIFSGISLGLLFNGVNGVWTNKTILKRYVKPVGCTLTVLLLLSANVIFISDLSWEHKYGDRLPIAHVALGKALNDLSSHNLTFASIDAGAIPYFSEWHHIDMAGLNNKFIAKHGVATIDYVEKENPQLVIFISRDGEIPRHGGQQEPFIEFVQKRHYTKLPPVKWQENYYLVSFLDPNVKGFDEIKEAVQKVSEASLRDGEIK